MIDMTGYTDIPDFGYCPQCPECGGDMGYNYLEGEFKCEDCGYILDEQDVEGNNYDEVFGPACNGCIQQDGFPGCKESCPIYDD